MLDDAVAQAEDLRQQRDMLAQTLADVGDRFDADGPDADNLQLLAESAKAAGELSEKMDAIDRRDRHTARIVSALGRDIGLDTDSDEILDVGESEKSLEEFAGYVRDMDMRSAQLAETMARIVDKIDRHQFETNADRLRSADYAGELVSLLNDFESINDSLIELERTQTELTETQGLLESNLVALDSANHNLGAVMAKNKNLEADVAYWKGQCIIERPPSDPQPPTRSASVLEVNYDWNYVIIDMGKKDLLQPNTELTVGRDKQFICSVRVSKVYDDHAVAEVLPKLRQGEVLAGDRVFY